MPRNITKINGEFDFCAYSIVHQKRLLGKELQVLVDKDIISKVNRGYIGLHDKGIQSLIIWMMTIRWTLADLHVMMGDPETHDEWIYSLAKELCQRSVL